MSSHPQPQPNQPHVAGPGEAEPSDRKVLFSAIGWLGVIFLFGVIVLIAYGGPGKRDAVSVTQLGGEERATIRAEREAAERKRAAGYEWVDQAKGVVRIPVERAMELTLAQLRAGEQPVGATPAAAPAAPAPNAAPAGGTANPADAGASGS